MDSALSWGLCDHQDKEHDLFGVGSADNIQAMQQNSDGTGEGQVIKIKGESCSMGNFARRLVCKLFSFDELVNCMGSKGKLDKRHWTTTILF